MDKWTEGEIQARKNIPGISKKYTLLLILLLIGFVFVFYLYSCTCYLGESICRKNGQLIDNKNPQTMDLNFSFLSIPGKVVYPWSSIMLREEGSVRLSLLIDKDGLITSSKVITSSGFPYLDKAALNSISTFSVNKEILDGENGEERTIKINFVLSDE
ncbi:MULTISPECIES: energy transducer TonB [unclassified Microbulbifer]|uniref:energy transducer TonB n=1 Tax=unclassified Microbulbifer TaxID=2619833 RepID=UPI0027E4DE76|nr:MULTISPECIES: energy transducer TonB [unclassified Microbulbifer]